MTELDPQPPLARAPEPVDGSLQALLGRLFGPQPDEPLADWLAGEPSRLGALAALAVAGLVTCGAVAGLFAGGEQVAITALKAPLIAVFSVLLCLPSLAVATALAGARWSARRLTAAALAFTAGLALLLAALLPVSWLFSVSSRRLTSVAVLHALVWLVAIAFARRCLVAFTGERARGALRLWTCLFVLVSFQAATWLQPVLWRAPGEALFPRPRQFFLEHFAATTKVELPGG